MPIRLCASNNPTRYSDGNPMSDFAKGAARGFGGCIGVLGAVFAIIFICVVIGMVVQNSSENIPAISVDPKQMCETAVQSKVLPGDFLVIGTDPVSGQKDTRVDWLVDHRGERYIFVCHMNRDKTGWHIGKITMSLMR